VLRPHDREDAEFDQVGLTAKRVEDVRVFFFGQPVGGDDIGCDFGHRAPLAREGGRCQPSEPIGALDRWTLRRHCKRMAEITADIAAMSFEDALRALEDVVRKLESGEVPLDDSITLYELGEQLRKHCQARLDAAQLRIERIVVGPDGNATGTQPFDDPGR
jgi:exodeoxyribonuclease VII small subunit